MHTYKIINTNKFRKKKKNNVFPHFSHTIHLHSKIQYFSFIRTASQLCSCIYLAPNTPK